MLIIKQLNKKQFVIIYIYKLKLLTKNFNIMKKISLLLFLIFGIYQLLNAQGAICPDDFEVCYEADPFELTGAEPPFGTYSGPGVSSNWFYPEVAGPGSHTILYYDMYQNQCTFVITVVLCEQEVLCPEDFEVCVFHAAFELTGAYPLGGHYAGQGVIGNMFNPENAGVGEHVITYYDTLQNMCQFIITVDLCQQEISCPEDFEVCIEAGPFELTGAVPLGGVYAGPGVQDNWFYPEIAGTGEHLITYYDPLQNQCQFYIAVEICAVETECPDDIVICIEADPFILTGAIPEGGFYAGPGIMLDWFYPEMAGPGEHIIYYWDPYQNHCTFTIIVEICQVICPDDFTVCVIDEPFELTGATPEGGTYAGPGVDDNWFFPEIAGEGEHLITYYDLEQNSCEFYIAVEICQPEVICPDDFVVCADDEPFELTGATPEGGIYAGPGVDDNWFFPEVAGEGNHIITYYDPNQNSCQFTISVDSCPQQISCPEDFEVYITDEPFELTGATPEGGTYFGPGVDDNWFFPEIAGLGEHLITYYDPLQNSCQFYIAVIEPVGIIWSKTNKINIYPNPNNGDFFVTANYPEESVIFEIYDINGRLVEKIIILTEKNSDIYLSTDLSSGLYYLKIINRDQTIVKKIIIE